MARKKPGKRKRASAKKWAKPAAKLRSKRRRRGRGQVPSIQSFLASDAMTAFMRAILLPRPKAPPTDERAVDEIAKLVAADAPEADRLASIDKVVKRAHEERARRIAQSLIGGHVCCAGGSPFPAMHDANCRDVRAVASVALERGALREQKADDVQIALLVRRLQGLTAHRIRDSRDATTNAAGYVQAGPVALVSTVWTSKQVVLGVVPDPAFTFDKVYFSVPSPDSWRRRGALGAS